MSITGAYVALVTLDLWEPCQRGRGEDVPVSIWRRQQSIKVLANQSGLADEESYHKTMSPCSEWLWLRPLIGALLWCPFGDFEGLPSFRQKKSLSRGQQAVQNHENSDTSWDKRLLVAQNARICRCSSGAVRYKKAFRWGRTSPFGKNGMRLRMPSKEMNWTPNPLVLRHRRRTLARPARRPNFVT